VTEAQNGSREDAKARRRLKAPQALFLIFTNGLAQGLVFEAASPQARPLRAFASSREPSIG
jgi:hypothetical protein